MLQFSQNRYTSVLCIYYWQEPKIFAKYSLMLRMIFELNIEKACFHRHLICEVI